MQLPPLAVIFAVLAAAPLASAEDCCPAPAPQGASGSPALSAPVASASANPSAAPGHAVTGHPLRGVIVAVLSEKSALLVKHDEIPGVMSAMSMLLKVDAATLAAAKKDQTISATLVKQPDGWWLHNVKADPLAK